MMGRFYDTPEAFDRALKKAVARSGGDSGSRYRQMIRDRFLCRVFYDNLNELVLKGGSGLLARIPDTRSTRDIDFGLSKRVNADEVVEELNALAARDLGDWCEFRLSKREESLDENGYSRLLKLRYATFIGQEEKDPVLIDLSLDCSTTLPPEWIKPANRIEIEGVETSDYLMYPLPDQLADKLCAVMEKRPGGWPSSRMKDLVDIVIYATHESFDLGQLSFAVRSECSKRGMEVPATFEAPSSWKDGFQTFARKNGLSGELATFPGACSLASSFYQPVLSDKGLTSAYWDYSALCWVVR